MTSATMLDAVYGYARSALRPEHLWHWTIFIVVSLAVATPLIFLILGSFSEASLPTQFTLSDSRSATIGRCGSTPTPIWYSTTP